MLMLCHEKPLLGLWKYFHRSKVGFGSTHKGLEIVFKSLKKGLRESIWFNKGRFWLHNAYRVCWKKLIIDLWKYFIRVEKRPWKYSQGVEDKFGKHPKGWRESEMVQ